jgi:hypothetical protein
MNEDFFTTPDYMIECGFNLLIYGHGSKLSYMRKFRETKLCSKPVLWVNCFHSAVSMKGLTNNIIGFC